MIGEHIRALKDGRWIHAIDCGDETVLYLAGAPAPRRVRRAYRPEFVAGARAVEAVTHRERTFPPAEIVRRAYSRSSDPALAQMFGDSEAFAEWCTSGRLPGPRDVAVRAPFPSVPPSAAPAPRAKALRKAKASAKRTTAKATRAKARPTAKPKRPPQRSARRRVAPRKTSSRRGRR